MTPLTATLLRICAILWAIWGLVHILAGIVILSSDATGAIAAMADAVDPATLARDYPAAAQALLHQHGWNLAWIGAVTLVCGVFIWRHTLPAIWLAALVGGLADIGYFVFMDLPGHVNFMPGTVMTIVSASAIALGLAAWLTTDRRPA